MASNIDPADQANQDLIIEECPDVPEDSTGSFAGTEESSLLSVSNYVQDLCSQYGDGWLCMVPLEYFEHRTNLRGFREQIPYYQEALGLILDKPLVGTHSQERIDCYKQIAFELYKLIHGRYILTDDGMQCLLKMYQSNKFGRCPRFDCYGQAVLPMGLTNILKQESVKVYCAKCSQIYWPGSLLSRDLDGGAFGPNIPALFYFNYPELRPKMSGRHYEARLFGFRIHPSVYEWEDEGGDEPQREVVQVKPPEVDRAKPDEGDVLIEKKKFGWYVNVDDRE